MSGIKGTFGQTRRGCAENVPAKYTPGKCYDSDDVEVPWPEGDKMVVADDEGDLMGNDTTMGLDWDELPEGEWNDTTQTWFETMMAEYESSKVMVTTTTVKTTATKSSAAKSTDAYKTVDEQKRSPQAWEVPQIKVTSLLNVSYMYIFLQVNVHVHVSFGGFIVRVMYWGNLTYHRTVAQKDG